MQGKGSGASAYIDGIQVGNALRGSDGVMVVVLSVERSADGLKCEYSVERYRMSRTRQSFPPL